MRAIVAPNERPIRSAGGVVDGPQPLIADGGAAHRQTPNSDFRNRDLAAYPQAMRKHVTSWRSP
jgi:hypothetical protein